MCFLSIFDWNLIKKKCGPSEFENEREKKRGTLPQECQNRTRRGMSDVGCRMSWLFFSTSEGVTAEAGVQ